ncbi:uncharacterized protein [Nicotiana tomentosiformis]|uniref:uncharacterized protein n=1 Tax=Nicotiana tomentosiformis TaxID=4098 RepID=UPI00388CC36A
MEKVKLIQERLWTTRSRQKNYADRKAREVAFMVGEKVLLIVLPMKGVMRFKRKGKLSPQYIGPFEVWEKAGDVAYRLTLPPNPWGFFHMAFHVSMFRKYYEDPSHVLNFSLVQLDKYFTYNKEPVAILDRQVRKLRSKDIASVKVQWRGLPVEEASWEIEHDMRNRYPHLFGISGMTLN